MAPHPHDSDRRARLANAWRARVPPLPDPTGPPRPPRRLEVFAVGTDWVQCTWSRLGPGTVAFTAAGAPTVTVAADGGPGAVVIDGLAAGARTDVQVRGPGVDTVVTTATLARPPGALLHRVATISDSHVGSHATGYFHTITELPRPDELHPVRCLRAAVSEAARWGADDLVIKGDLVDESSPELWATAGQALHDGLGCVGTHRDGTAPAGASRSGISVSMVAGNHEWSTRGDGDPIEGAASIGLELARGCSSLDRPGVRLVLVDSVEPGHDRGHYDPVRVDAAALTADAPHRALVVVHHQPLSLPVPTYLPAGVARAESQRFFRALGALDVPVLVTAGHTHRHRRRTIAGVTVTEVGSTKDFPGTWAGYEIYEGGMVQTVRRIAEPTCIRWTDWTRRAAAGVWQRWSPGRLADRCFTLP